MNGGQSQKNFPDVACRASEEYRAISYFCWIPPSDQSLLVGKGLKLALA